MPGQGPELHFHVATQHRLLSTDNVSCRRYLAQRMIILSSCGRYLTRAHNQTYPVNKEFADDFRVGVIEHVLDVLHSRHLYRLDPEELQFLQSKIQLLGCF